MSKRIKTGSAYLNICLAHRWMLQLIRDKYGLTSIQVEIVLCVEKLTSGEMGYCKPSELKIFLTGNASYHLYKNLHVLFKMGILLNHGRKTFIIGLSDDGNKIADHIHNSLIERINYLNDKLKLKNISAMERKERKKKKGVNKKDVPL